MESLTIDKQFRFQNLYKILLQNTQPHSQSKDLLFPYLNTCLDTIAQLFNYPKQDASVRVAPNTTTITIDGKQYNITESFRKAMAILSNEIDIEEIKIAESMITYSDTCYSESELADSVMNNLCLERKALLDCLLLILDCKETFKNNHQLIVPLTKFVDKLFEHKDPISKKGFAQALLESLDKSISKSCYLDQSSSSSFLNLVSRNMVAQWHMQLSDECFNFAHILLLSGKWYRKDKDFMTKYVEVLKQVEFKHPAFNFLLLSFMFSILPSFLNEQSSQNFEQIKEQLPIFEKLYTLLTEEGEWKVKEAKHLILIYLILAISPYISTQSTPTSTIKLVDLPTHIETSIKANALSLWKKVLSKVRSQYLVQNECSSSVTHLLNSNIEYNELDHSIHNRLRTYPIQLIELTENISNNLIINLITQYTPQLRRIKNFEDDILASSTRKPELKQTQQTNLTFDFLDCITLTYTHAKNLSTTQFFLHGDMRLNHFLTWSSDLGMKSGHYFNMLSSLINNQECVNLVLKFLWASDDRLFGTAMPIYYNSTQHSLPKLDVMVSKMDQLIEAAFKTPTKSQDIKESEWVQSFINLVFTLIYYNLSSREIFSKINVDLVTKLLNILCTPIYNHVKATALDCLRAIVRFTSDDNTDEVHKVWKLIEAYQLVPHLPQTSTPPQFPLAEELLHNEKVIKDYSQTIALIRLFTTLLYPVTKDAFSQPQLTSSIPQDLNSQCGPLGYIQFAIKLIVQPDHQRQFIHPIDEWLIKYEGLKFIDACLETLDFRIVESVASQPFVLAQQGQPQITNEWNKLAFNPGFFCLIRFLGDNRLTSSFLDGFKDASILLSSDENPLIQNYLLLTLKIFQILIKSQPSIQREILPKLYHIPLNPTIKQYTQTSQTILDLISVREEGLGPLAYCFQFGPNSIIMELASKTLLLLLNNPQLSATKLSKDRLLSLFDKCKTDSLIQTGISRRLEDLTIYLDNNFFPLNTNSSQFKFIKEFTLDLDQVLTFLLESINETRNFPNLAFNTLGYEANNVLLPYGNRDNLIQPTIKEDSQSGLINLLQALSFNVPSQLDQISAVVSTNPTNFVHFKFPQLTSKMFNVLAKLSQHTLCREPTLRFLRHYGEFYCQQLTLAAVQYYNPSDEGYLTLPNGSNVSASYEDALNQMKFRSFLIQLAALELHQSALQGYRIPSNNI
ncbi:hypothetical protein CONCODRAFT_80634, partial [Conidiobolus coronatus NRRL 28638]